jgi:hypothetical protein
MSKIAHSQQAVFGCRLEIELVGDDGSWPTGLASLAGQQARFRSRFRRDSREARWR